MKGKRTTIDTCIACGQEGVPGYFYKAKPDGSPGDRQDTSYCEVCWGSSYAYTLAMSRDGVGVASVTDWHIYQLVARVGLLILMELRRRRR